jgi:hypothetical protein
MALLLLRGTIDPKGVLEGSWEVGNPLCTWVGITCNQDGLATSM